MLAQLAVSTIFVHYCTSMTISKMLNCSGVVTGYTFVKRLLLFQTSLWVLCLYCAECVVLHVLRYSYNILWLSYSKCLITVQKYLSISCKKSSLNQCSRGTRLCWTSCIFCELSWREYLSIGLSCFCPMGNLPVLVKVSPPFFLLVFVALWKTFFHSGTIG